MFQFQQQEKLPSVSWLINSGNYIIHFLSFDGESFETAASSKCDHDYTFGLANYRGNALSTGSYHNTGCYVRTEVYNFGTNQWNNAPDYPFGS